MVVKDRIVTWFIRNIIIPRMEDIDHPGYIVSHLDRSNKSNIVRQILSPESLFVEIEEKVFKQFGMKGRKALYRAGKTFGYDYGISNNFKTLNKSSKKEIKKLISYLVPYIETLYASNMSYEIDMDKQVFRLELDNFVVCRKNGIGDIITSGAIAGFWSVIMDNPDIEGVQFECQGRGDPKCNLICAPKKELKKMNYSYFDTPAVKVLQTNSEYQVRNQIKKTTHITKSLKTLVGSNIFDYKHGVLKYKDDRYFITEASLPDLLEIYLSKLGAGRLLFDVAFEFGSRICQYNKDTNFFSDYLSALGWGEVIFNISQKTVKILSNHLPWTMYSDKTKKLVFCGLLSGLVSEYLNKRTELKLTNISKLGNSYSAVFSK